MASLFFFLPSSRPGTNSLKRMKCVRDYLVAMELQGASFLESSVCLLPPRFSTFGMSSTYQEFLSVSSEHKSTSYLGDRHNEGMLLDT